LKVQQGAAVTDGRRCRFVILDGDYMCVQRSLEEQGSFSVSRQFCRTCVRCRANRLWLAG